MSRTMQTLDRLADKLPRGYAIETGAPVTQANRKRVWILRNRTGAIVLRSNKASDIEKFLDEKRA